MSVVRRPLFLPHALPLAHEDDIEQATWSGCFDVLGIRMQVHILASGKRVIEQDSIIAFMDRLVTDKNFSLHVMVDDTASTFWQWVNHRC